MPGRYESTKKQSMRMAFCGMTVALSVVLMLMSGLIPIMTYASPLAAGILLLPVLAEFGRKYAWTVWLAASLIVVVLGADKEAAFFYLFLGYYPVLKWELEKQRHLALKLLIKTAIFSAAIACMYAILAFVLHLDVLTAEFAEMGTTMTVVFFVMLVICMHFYDRLLLPLLTIYVKKLRPRLRFLRAH